MKVSRIVWTTLVMSFLGALLFGQSQLGQTPRTPAFEVAAIRPSEPLPILITQIRSGAVRPGITVSGNRFYCHMSLDALIAEAFRIDPSRIVGPDWLSSQRFEIQANMPEGTSRDQVPEMLQALLEERFKLKSDFEDREHEVYGLVVSNDGPSLIDADDAPAATNADTMPVETTDTSNSQASEIVYQTRDGVLTVNRQDQTTFILDGRKGPIRTSVATNGWRRTAFQRISMSAFAEWLTPLAARPVIDATNLTGFYSITVELPLEVFHNAIINRPQPLDLAAALTPFGTGAGGVPIPDTNRPVAEPIGGSVFDAVETLGLRLDPRQAPITTLIIEHMEQSPTEN